METIVLPVVIISGAGLLFGILLSFAAKFFAVPVDERAQALRDALPGVNCGACGFAGCDEYSAKLNAGEAPTNLCTPGGDSVSKELSAILGVAFADVEEKHALVRCSGTFDTSVYVMEYLGESTCEACNAFYQGRRSCSYGCLGFGDCQHVCKYDAISIVDGLAVIDHNKCTGCGMCAKRCPNLLIQLVKKTSKIYVGCNSTDKGAYTRKLCKKGCIGCMKCQKTCRFDAIEVKNNLARVNPDKCTCCGECVPVCPVGVIKRTEDCVLIDAGGRCELKAQNNERVRLENQE